MTRIVKAKRKSLTPTEDHEQIMFVTWLRNQGYRVAASANGGKRNLFEAMKLKRMGVSAGFPDIFVPLPRAIYHGFFVEMKRVSGGKVSDLQLEWLSYLRLMGYYAEVANGFDEARELFMQYLKLH